MRLLAERIARIIALALLGWSALSVFRPAAAGLERASGNEVADRIRGWSAQSAPSRVHVRLDSLGSPAWSDWLRAIADAGTAVGWDAPAIVPLAVTADPVADPEGGTRVLVAAPAGSIVFLEDSVGVLDSARAADGGARFLARSAPAAIRARTGGWSAWSAVRDSLTLGRILLLGHTGWETKFVAAALEERGWQVDAAMALSPRGDVEQGRIGPIEPAVYSAVVALDTTAAPRAPAIARYAQRGGGVILAAPALASAALFALSPGLAGEVIAAIEPYDTGFADPRRPLELTPVSLRPDAIALERRAPRAPAVAVRRAGQGRVAVVGYHDTWRWRLGGRADAVARHREWWASLVASVAAARSLTVGRPPPRDESPLARLTQLLGEPAAPPPAGPAARSWTGLLFGLLLAALLLEWASRRLAGRDPR